MGRLRSVTFRGEEIDVEIDHDGGYEYDTNTHVIEWHFYGLTPEQHDALKVTDKEDQEIFAQLAEASGESEDYD